MEASTFRRDPWLRSSAYHLATWSLAAFLFELRLGMKDGVDTASRVAALVVLIGASAMSSMTHERRVAKMAGPAGAAVWPAAGRMWLLLLSGLGAASVVLATGSLGSLLFPLWAVGVGAGFGVWARRASFAWYAGLGWSLVGAGVIDLALGATAGPVEPFRTFVLGLALPAFTLVTNRRFLWFRD